MINTDDFVKRLELLFDFYGLSSSSFADKISVQRSSLSHLLSGRNKPSLDLILKIIDVFTEVDFYWLVFGKGNFPKNNYTENILINDDLKLDSPTPQFENQENKTTENSFEILNNNSFKNEEKKIEEKKIDMKKLERIVLFYTDGSFIEYLQ